MSENRSSIDLDPTTTDKLPYNYALFFPFFLFVLQIFKPFTLQILISTHQQKTALENIVGKEEIARNEQFLLFPQCFLLNQKVVFLFVNVFDIISLFAAELEESKIGI